MALTTAFCANGDKTPIPPTTADGSVSYDQGFGASYARPPEEGGKFIDRAQFNQLMYDTTSQVIANTTAIATKANSSEVVKLTGDQNIKGVKTFTNNISSPNITEMQNNLNTIFSSTTSPVRYQNSTKVITVGTGGNFQTIQEAIQEARKYSSNVEIKLVSNISISKNIYLLRLNGQHITIRFEGFKIINSTRSNLAFTFSNCSLADIVDLNLENVSLILTRNSSVYLGGSVNINCENINSDCIRADYLSNICMVGPTTCNVKHSTDYLSLNSLRGSSISIGDGSIINDSSSSGRVLNVYRSIIYTAANVTINSTIPKANQVANTLTDNGIIFGNYSL